MFIEDREDSDAIGYRAGIFVSAGAHAHIGVGLVYTKLQDCTDTIFNDCSETYTEVRIKFSM